MVKLGFQYRQFNSKKCKPNHTTSKYLLSIKHAPGFGTDTGYTMGNKTTRISAITEFTFYQGVRQEETEREAVNK